VRLYNANFICIQIETATIDRKRRRNGELERATFKQLQAAYKVRYFKPRTCFFLLLLLLLLFLFVILFFIRYYIIYLFTFLSFFLESCSLFMRIAKITIIFGVGFFFNYVLYMYFVVFMTIR